MSANPVGRVLAGSAQFLYKFLVGDDWIVAVVMLLGLVATAVLVAAKVSAWWLIPALAVVMTQFSIRRHART
ncbi:MAG TPA: hypothetical protein VF137_10655 [Candidatus Dormibacteraeota bacterium]